VLARSAALVVYKLVLMHRHRNGSGKSQALLCTDQVFPKRMRRFTCDEHDDKNGSNSVPDSHPK
jgi:hypothetical protein